MQSSIAKMERHPIPRRATIQAQCRLESIGEYINIAMYEQSCVECCEEIAELFRGNVSLLLL